MDSATSGADESRTAAAAMLTRQDFAMDQPTNVPVPQQPAVRVDPRLGHTLAVAALVAACFVIAEPFLSAATWAVILAVSAGPSFARLNSVLRSRRRLAGATFAVAGVVVLILPLVLAGVSAARRAPAAMQAIDYLEQSGLPGPPEAVAHVPLVGPRLHDLWAGISEQGSEVLGQYRAEINASVGWLLRRAGSFGLTVLQFTLAIVIAALLLVRADRATALLRAFAARIGGAEALDLLPLAEHTIRAVSLGVVGTALAEGVLSAAGFTIAGQQYAVLLGGATFLICLLQVGPGFVFVPAAAWMWWRGETGWAVFVLAWHLALVLPIEVFGRPFFISRDTGLPLLLIFVGVLGGLLAFGFIGVFVGPTVFAVSYAMLLRWLVPPTKPGGHPGDAIEQSRVPRS
jgi:predicted PurR-regulated permease PerM